MSHSVLSAHTVLKARPKVYKTKTEAGLRPVLSSDPMQDWNLIN